MTDKNLTSTYSVFSDLVYNLVEQPQRVFLSIYDIVEELEDGTAIIQYPDLNSREPVIEGTCKFAINDPGFSPNLVLSDNLNSPTWKDLLNCCNELLGKCKDFNTGFLCDVVPGPEGMYEFALMK